MSRVRLLCWGLGLVLASPVFARQWTNQPTAPSQPSQQNGQGVVPAVGINQPGPGDIVAVTGSTTKTPQPVPAPAAPTGPSLMAPAEKVPAVRQKASTTSPIVTIEKRCPDTVKIGTTLSYEIVVRNVGTVPVALVRVEDELPLGAKYAASEPAADPVGSKLMWMLGDMAPGAERKITVNVQPSVEGDFQSTAVVSFSAATVMRTQVVSPKLAITMTGPDKAMCGDAAAFQIQVSNPGTGPLSNLAVRVKLPPGLQHPNGNYIEADLGTLAAGATRTIPLQATVTGIGPVAAEVIATGESVTEATAKVEMQLLQPRLQIRRVGPTKVFVKGEVTEEIEIINSGNAATGDVTLVEVLPASLEYLGASDGGAFDAATRTVTWKLGPAPAGAHRSVAVKSRGIMVGEHLTRAVGTADRGLESRTEGTVSVEGIPAIAVEVVAIDDPAEVNSEMTFEVRVVNRGSATTTNIQIQAIVPEGMVPNDTTGPTQGRVAGQQVTFEPLARLATKADAVYRIKVRAMQAGDHRFKVQMNCDQLRVPVNKEEAARVYQN